MELLQDNKKEATADDPEEKYEATQSLDRIYKTLKIVDCHFSFKQTERKMK